MTLLEAIFLLIIGLIIVYFSFFYDNTTPEPLEYDYLAFAERQREEKDFQRRVNDGMAWRKSWLNKEGKND